MSESYEDYTKKVLREYKAENEDELYRRMFNDAETLFCLNCKKELKWEDIEWQDGDPYCFENCDNDEIG